MTISLERAALATLLLASIARGQGSDSCATAQAIAGYGTFPYVNAGQTTGTQGQSDILCTFYGDTAMYRDVWFTWTAPMTERVWVHTCGLTTFNTKMAVHAGSGCPSGGAIWCNDDYCGSQAAVVFDAVAGNTYTLQLASGSSASSGGNGSFEFAPAPVLSPCGGNSGPDLIVSAIPGLSNYTAADGVDAFSVGSTGTNLGDEIAKWIAPTNDHPVIRHNVYGYRTDGAGSRFEQLGLSWLKHGFGSAQDSDYCSCNPGGNFYHLGVGCSDTYNSFQSGVQGDLGPNWQVDAHTGVFTFPAANPPIVGSMARRCQIPLASLSVSSSSRRYLTEVHYVTKDDAAAGNQNNNATWQQLNVSGGPTNYTFGFGGTIHPGESAIRAWLAIDPLVTLTDVQIPGDGLVVVGSRAWRAGGAKWCYEFAVYNMNADRNVGSFSVPIPAGCVVSNVGFHDVAHHSGDGIGSVSASGLDWTAVESAGTLTWSCVAQAVDANANAIRWGTLYNFRFDADVPPASGLVSFEPWKPGAPSAMSAAASVPSSAPITAFCAGDGSGTACPCANAGASDRGCENSFTTGGAQLTGSGATIVSADQLRLDVTGLPPGDGISVLFFQGDANVAGGSGAVFGDGLRCSGGNVIRLGARSASGGVLGFGAGVAGDPAISIAGALPTSALSVRSYQAWYRNAASFCTAGSFNLSNGLRAVWMP